MTGHVFHPGHEELHGVTVVVRERGGRLTVGRYHETGPNGVVLHDAAVKEAEPGDDGSTWLAAQKKFGVRVDRRLVVVPVADVASITRLSLL